MIQAIKEKIQIAFSCPFEYPLKESLRIYVWRLAIFLAVAFLASLPVLILLGYKFAIIRFSSPLSLTTILIVIEVVILITIGAYIFIITKRRRQPCESLDIALTALHYAPYILATAYYFWRLRDRWIEHRTEKDIKKKVNLWAEESIDKIFQMVLEKEIKINEENCRKDMEELVKILNNEVGERDLPSASEILANKMFNILKKYYPDAGSREREWVAYIVGAEWARLNFHQASEHR